MKLHEHNILKKQEERKFLKTADVIRNTETKENDAPFDPERDITPEDWEVIYGLLATSRRSGLWNGFANALRYVVLLSSKRKEQFYLTIYGNRNESEIMVEQDLLMIKRQVIDELKRIPHDNFFRLQLVSAFCILYSEKRNEIFVDNSQKKLYEINFDIFPGNFLNFSDYFVNYKNYFPNKSVYGEDKSEDDFFQENKDKIFDQNGHLDASAAGNLLLLCPNHRKNLNITREMWRQMLEDYQTKRRLAQPRFDPTSIDFESEEWLRWALGMYILSAESAEITSDGQIKITPKPKPLHKDEPLPVRPV